MKIDNDLILTALEKTKNPSDKTIDTILAKAKNLKGLDFTEAATLLHVQDSENLKKIYEAAAYVKEAIYGNRLVLFAPLYISNLCANECLYCAFRMSNREITRRALDQAEIEKETAALLKQGHKRILVVAGENYLGKGLDYICDAIDSVYRAEYKGQKIRRVNINVAPLTEEEFKKVAKHKIGTYQCFQETYHEPTYKQQHIKGPKTDFQFRLDAMERAMKAGISDVGIGPLLGLYDYKFEVLAMLQHIAHLEKVCGVGPHTISVPRIEPAAGSSVSQNPPYKVSDEDFKKLVAVLRITVPYTGIIMSTRESPKMRDELINMGVSQMSAGSRTNPGGYEEEKTTSQFTLSDERTMEQVLESLIASGHVPSYCTGCYRLGRVGKDFMDLAKPGLIKEHCSPNAIFTFAEYLEDFAPEELKKKGYALIEKTIKTLPKSEKVIRENLEKIKSGKRDIYV